MIVSMSTKISCTSSSDLYMKSELNLQEFPELLSHFYLFDIYVNSWLLYRERERERERTVHTVQKHSDKF